MFLGRSRWSLGLSLFLELLLALPVFQGSYLLLFVHISCAKSELRGYSSTLRDGYSGGQKGEIPNRIQKQRTKHQNDKSKRRRIEQTQISESKCQLKSKCLNAKTIPVCPLNFGLDLISELCNLTLLRVWPMRLPRPSVEGLAITPSLLSLRGTIVPKQSVGIATPLVVKGGPIHRDPPL